VELIEADHACFLGELDHPRLVAGAPRATAVPIFAASCDRSPLSVVAAARGKRTASLPAER